MKNLHLWKSIFVIFLNSLLRLHTAFALSASSSSSSSSSPLGISLDRFRATCPTKSICIRQFDESLVVGKEDKNDDSVWVAVYRTNNNKPSVMVRDEFFHAMKAATTTSSSTSATEDGGDESANSVQTDTNPTSPLLETPLTGLEKPVAVAELRPSSDYPGKFVLQNLRCTLKKEAQDETCDGGSEFTEALGVCVDALILQFLKTHNSDEFEGTIRTKATLFSNKLVETRGWEPVEELSKDMATHVSRYHACLDSFAQRAAQVSINAGARDRALQIVSLLGKLEQPPSKNKDDDNDNNDNNKDEYDPWAGASLFG